jgi:hypothetical protein
MPIRLKIKSWPRLIPVLVLLVMLFYLGSVNSTCEVYIDLVSNRFRFQVARSIYSTRLVELMTNLPVNGVQLVNCNLEVYPTELQKEEGSVRRDGLGMTKVGRRAKEVSSQIIIERSKNLLFRSLSVPAGSHIAITNAESVITLSISQAGNAASQGAAIHGKIGVGDGFILSGKNIQFSDLDNYHDYELVEVATHKRRPNVAFWGDGEEVVLQFFLTESHGERWDTMIENVVASNIAFTIIEKAERRDRNRSGVKSGTIQIGGVDLFRKRFLIKEQAVSELEFVDIPDNEEYLIDFVRVNNEGLVISLFSERARDIKMGKRNRLVRSIFPSMLDFIVAEPSKKTVWAIFIFVVTQALFLSKFFRQKRQ